MKKNLRTLIIALLASSALIACGRNSGVRTRAYPGMEKMEAALEAARPKCVPFDLKRVRGTSVITGKEKFKNDRKGMFKLNSYVVSQSTDRADRTVPNSILQVTEFDDLASLAPRLAIEAKCVDLKGSPQSLVVSPVTQIDSANGSIVQAQPFDLEIDERGAMRAESKKPIPSRQSLPAGKVPEVALLLGTDYQSTYKTISFQAMSSEDGSLVVKAEFVGMDSNLSRIFIRVEATYGWDSAE